MSIRQKQDGEDLVLEAVNRTFNSSRKEVIRYDGNDGSVTLGDLVVDTHGAVTIAGTALVGGDLADDTVLAANKDFTYAAGDGVFDASLGTGVFKSNTGTNTLGGNVVIAGSKTFTTGTGISTFSGKIAAGATAFVIADPGNGGAIAVTTSGVCNITTAGAETRTLAVPTFVGQTLTVCMTVDGGDAVITVASAFNQATNTTITLNDAGDAVHLIGALIAGTRRWRLIANDGATLG